MTEQTQVIRIVIDASKAKEGSDEARDALKRIEQQTEQIGAGLERMGSSISGAFSKIKATLLGFLSFEFINSQIKGLRAAFDDLGSRASTLGVTTKWMQEFQFAAASASVKIESASGALDKFSRLVGDAALGNKAAVETMNDLGIKIFDAQKQVRPLNDLFEEAAKKLAGMESSAARNALAVATMGKEAQKVVPMLDNVARGQAAMERAAAAVTIPADKVKIWEDLASAAEKNFLRWRAFGGSNFAEPVKQGFEAIAKVIDATLPLVVKFINAMRDLYESSQQFMREQNVAPLRARLAAVDPALSNAQKHLDRQENLLAQAENFVVTMPSDRTRIQLEKQRVETENARKVFGEIKAEKEKLTRDIVSYSVGSPSESPAPSYPGPPQPPTSGTTGAYAATVKDDGASGDRYSKRLEALKAEADAQRQMAEAAKIGTSAVMEQEAKLKATKDALEVYGATAKATDPQVQKLAAQFKALNDEIAQGKLVTQFRLATREIEDQNRVVELELRLVNELPEVRAREIALLKVKQDAERSGLVLSAEDLAARTKAVEQQELLKIKVEETAKAQELWTQPLKTALSSIQSELSGFFENIFTGGVNSWQSLTQAIKRIWIKMLAELAAVSVIKPLIQPVLGAGMSMGLITPQAAASLGYGSGGGFGFGGGAGGTMSSGGGFSMPGGSGLGGGMSSWQLPEWLGGGRPFGFLNSPVMPGSMPAGQYGPAMPGLGGMTWGNVLGGAMGVGMGAYQLITGNGSTGSTIGGIGSMVGGVVSMIPGLQPVGMAISLLSSFLPGLFGDDKPKLPPLAGANVQWSYGPNGYTAKESQMNGGAAIGGKYGGVPSQIEALFKATGGTVTDPSKVFGAAVWQNYREGQTSTYIISPTQGSNNIWTGSGDAGPQIDRMVARAFAASVVNGALSGVSDTLMKALQHRDLTSIQDANYAISGADRYDHLLDKAPAAAAALKEINASFDEMTEWAQSFGMSVAPVEEALKKARAQYAEDYMDTINSAFDPLGVALKKLAKEREDGMKEAQYIADNVSDVFIDMARVAEYYTKKEADLRKQFYASELSNLQSLIDRLTFGDLAGGSAALTLSGTGAAYRAALAQSRAGDVTATSNLSSLAEAYVNAGRANFASSPEYYALIAEVRAQLEERQSALSGGVVATGSASNVNEATTAVLQQNAQLTEMVRTLAQQVADVTSRLDQTNAQLQRYNVNRGA